MRSCVRALAALVLLLGLGQASCFNVNGIFLSRPASLRPATEGISMIASTPNFPSRREALSGIASAAVLSVLSSPFPAAADRSFTSMTTAVRNFFEVDLKAAIDKQDWAAVSEAVSEKGKAYRLAYVEKYSSGVVKEVVELKGVMKIFASSITASDSEGPQTQKLYQYLTKYADFCQKIKEAAAAADKEAATKAWIGGSFALRIFMDSVNGAIPRSVGKVDLPPPPAEAAAAFPTLKPS